MLSLKLARLIFISLSSLCILFIYTRFYILVYIIIEAQIKIQLVRYKIQNQMNKEALHINQQKILNINQERQDIQVVVEDGRKYIKGARGHNSCFMKKPIIEGRYYLEIIGSKSGVMEGKYKSQPSFRVGVAPTEYYYNYPLGQNYSIAYKMNGMVIQQGAHVATLKPYTFGDVVGIGLNISEVYKKRDKQTYAKSNYVQFFVNGQSAGSKLYLLTEDFYTFSASLFNQSRVCFNYEANTIKFLPKDYLPYSLHLFQKSQYSDFELKAYQRIVLSQLGFEKNSNI